MKIYDWKWRKILVELKFQFSRSSGPGGQKVNKTESKAELRWLVKESSVFDSSQKEKLQSRLGHSINSEGELVIASDQFRSRERNKKDVCDRLRKILEKALHESKKRKKTKPTKSSIKKRLEGKKKHSDKKKARGKIRASDY